MLINLSLTDWEYYTMCVDIYLSLKLHGLYL
jgi:hypothetical protein